MPNELDSIDPPQIGGRFETEAGEPHTIQSVEAEVEQVVTADVGLGIRMNQRRYFVRDELGDRWALEWDGDRYEGRRSPRRV